EQWFTGTVVVRDLAVVGLCVLVVRQIYRPAEDLVRSGPPPGCTAVGPPGAAGAVPGVVDDPAGGVLDGADDPPGRVWRGRPRRRAGRGDVHASAAHR